MKGTLETLRGRVQEGALQYVLDVLHSRMIECVKIDRQFIDFEFIHCVILSHTLLLKTTHIKQRSE